MIESSHEGIGPHPGHTNRRFRPRGTGTASSVVLLALALSLACVKDLRGHPPGEHGHEIEDHPRTPLIESLQVRVDDRPDDTIARSKLAHARLARGRSTGSHDDLDAAEADYRALLERLPASIDARHGLAQALQGGHRFDEALEVARDVSRRAPDEPSSWALLGDVHLALGHLAEAEALFMRLYEHAITLPGRSRMGMIHEARGRLEDAARAYHEAIEAGRLLNAPASDIAWCQLRRATSPGARSCWVSSR